MGYGFKIIVEGDYACFTRPELKVERVSYDVPTPGAFEGLLKSVYWKPAIRYVIDKIIVFNPINFINIRRNEVKEKIPLNKVRQNMHGGENDLSLYTSECRHQRAAMVLKNVKYGIEFHFELTGIRSDAEDEGEAKHYSIIRRRLENGKYFRTPCLGCSEFPVKSITLKDCFNLNEIDREILAMGDADLGYMLYRLNFADGGEPVNKDWSSPVFSDMASAVYYRPRIVNGVINVAEYAEGLKC